MFKLRCDNSDLVSSCFMLFVISIKFRDILSFIICTDLAFRFLTSYLNSG